MLGEARYFIHAMGSTDSVGHKSGVPAQALYLVSAVLQTVVGTGRDGGDSRPCRPACPGSGPLLTGGGAVAEQG